MGDEERLDTMLKAFHETMNVPYDKMPLFVDEKEYYLIQKDNPIREMVSDAWDWFKKGWEARGNVDESTVEGW